MVGENIYMVSTSEDFVLASGPNEWFYRHNKKDGEAIKLLLTIGCRRRIYYLLWDLLLKGIQTFAVSTEVQK